MERIETLEQLRQWRSRQRQQSLRVAFVPTMGALHQGHLALVRAAQQRADRVIVSIFVNPTQFGPHEDFDRYPRLPEQDSALLQMVGCHALFLPNHETIYPAEHQTTVQVTGLDQKLCGRLRPGHFQGVATVVTILLNLVQPDTALFGLKDYQQFVLIRRMVRDLRLPVQVEGVATVREPDGLALSSRNRYLSPVERQRATALFQALTAAGQLYRSGENRRDVLIDQATGILQRAGIHQIDYVELCDPDTLATAPEQMTDDVIMLIAARLTGARLIDNLLLTAH
ncbi:MAG: pantoate--beta-alanine ligase [Magnetococcales bacterium]|nr:pantoate--beta-alanine ligase [Magnetococcales bacterium]